MVVDAVIRRHWRHAVHQPDVIEELLALFFTDDSMLTGTTQKRRVQARRKTKFMAMKGWRCMFGGSFGYCILT